ncbi:MAG: thioesterase family protein [bacterium]
MRESLKDYPVVVECRVNWGDMDAFQHVNNAMYFRYLENARIVYGEKIRIAERMKTEGLGPILKWTECKYIRPLAYPDTALVGTRSMSLEDGELKSGYIVFSEAQEAVVAVGTSIGVFYDYKNRRRADFPEDIVERIEMLEGKPLPRRHDPEYKL